MMALVLVSGIVGTKTNAGGEQRPGLLGAYYPAYCRPAAFPSRNFELIVLGANNTRRSLNVPLRLDLLTYARDGMMLYALTREMPFCLNKIELNPVRVTAMACPRGLTSVFNFSTSTQGDRLLISGGIEENGHTRCGVFQVRLPEPTAQPILETESCGADAFAGSWGSLSISPGADYAVAVRRDRLELIDINNRSSRVLMDKVLKATWSPDGNWIAAVTARGPTALISTGDFKIKRTVAETEGQWSPDSRYLLRVKGCLFPMADNSVGTIQALDVATGKSVSVKSSHCEVGFASTGWVALAP
jgi:hypothetical protein